MSRPWRKGKGQYGPDRPFPYSFDQLSDTIMAESDRLGNMNHEEKGRALQEFILSKLRATNEDAGPFQEPKNTTFSSFFDKPTDPSPELTEKAIEDWKKREAVMTVTSFKSAREDPMYFAPPLVLNDKIGYLEGELTTARGKIEKLEEELYDEYKRKADRKRCGVMDKDEPATSSAKRSAPEDRALGIRPKHDPASWEKLNATLKAKNAELQELLQHKEGKIQQIMKKLEIRTSESHDLCKLHIQRGKEYDEKEKKWKVSDRMKDLEIEEFGIVLEERDAEIEELKEQKEREITQLREALNQKTLGVQGSEAMIQKVRTMERLLNQQASDVKKKDSEILSLQKQLEECKRRQELNDEQSEQSDDSFEKVLEEDSEGSESGWSNVGDNEEEQQL